MCHSTRPVALSSVLALLLAGACLAGNRHRYVIDPESPDGTLLQQILQDRSPDHRKELLERYVHQFPQVASTAWAEEQLVLAYSQTQDADHLLPLAEQLLVLDPADLDTANKAIRAAGTIKDPDLGAKWGLLAWEVTQRAQAAPDADKGLLAEVRNYADFVLYSAAHEILDPAKKVMYFKALEERDPDNEYARGARLEYINAVLQTAGPEHRLPVIEKELGRFPEDEDLLFMAVQETAKLNSDGPTLNYALRLLALMGKKVAPEGVTPADWSKKRFEYTSIASWYAGSIYSKQGDYGASDRYLRAALPYLQDKSGMLAAAYYTLGYNSYTIASDSRDPGRAQEALRYNQLCANIKSPYQASAQKNLEALKAEFHLQ